MATKAANKGFRARLKDKIPPAILLNKYVYFICFQGVDDILMKII